MTDRYTPWAIALAALLEGGIFLLSYLDVIGTDMTISCGFAVGAVLVTALMLRPARDEPVQTTIDLDPWHSSDDRK